MYIIATDWSGYAVWSQLGYNAVFDLTDLGDKILVWMNDAKYSAMQFLQP